ncbi:MAG: mRNA 3' end processing factor [Marteilia pararefringens]
MVSGDEELCANNRSHGDAAAQKASNCRDDAAAAGGEGDVRQFVSRMHLLERDISRDLIFALTTDAANLVTKNLGQALSREILKYFEGIKSPKLGILYLIDSFLKKFGVKLLPDLYESYLPDFFCKAFLHDERIRLQLYNLRKSWNKIFDVDYLDRIDIRIYHLDKKWPLRSSEVKECYKKRFNIATSDQPAAKKALVPVQNKVVENVDDIFHKKCHHFLPILDRYKSINRKFEIHVGSKFYNYTLGDPPIEIEIGHKTLAAKIEESSMQLTIGDDDIYSLYNPPATFDKLSVYFCGQELPLYINNELYLIHHYGPPTFIPLNEKIFKFQIVNFSLFINDKKVSETCCEEACHKIDNVDIMIAFYPPASPIIYKNESLMVVFHSYFPLISMDSGYSIAYFGGDQNVQVLINRKQHELRPYTLSEIIIDDISYSISLGGPFYELIVNGVCFPINFDESEHKIMIQGNEIFVQFCCQPPKLEIIKCPKFISDRSLVIEPAPIKPKRDTTNQPNLLTLLSKLSDHGLLPTKSATKINTPSVETTENPKSNLEIPDFTKFDRDLLSTFSEAALNDLQSSIYCHLCGAAFSRSQGIDLHSHLITHSESAISTTLNDDLQSLRSCQAYFTLPEWIHHNILPDNPPASVEQVEKNADVPSIKMSETSKNAMELDLIKNNNDESNSQSNFGYVVVDELDCATDFCATCGEKLEHRWMDRIEKWVVYESRIVDGEIYHCGCI